jgi:hypothetical protein
MDSMVGCGSVQLLSALDPRRLDIGQQAAFELFVSPATLPAIVKCLIAHSEMKSKGALHKLHG